MDRKGCTGTLTKEERDVFFTQQEGQWTTLISQLLNHPYRAPGFFLHSTHCHFACSSGHKIMMQVTHIQESGRERDGARCLVPFITKMEPFSEIVYIRVHRVSPWSYPSLILLHYTQRGNMYWSTEQGVSSSKGCFALMWNAIFMPECHWTKSESFS